jgi:uncharacterized protein (UPF0297 family)
VTHLSEQLYLLALDKAVMPKKKERKTVTRNLEHAALLSETVDSNAKKEFVRSDSLQLDIFCPPVID